MNKKERTPQHIVKACEFSPFVSFVFEMLLLYEWDSDFRDGLGIFQESGLGIARHVLADMWEKEADFNMPDIRLIAEMKKIDGGRQCFYRLKSLVYRWLEGTEQEWESLSDYMIKQDREEVSKAEEPYELIYPSMIRLFEKMAENTKTPFAIINLWGRQGTGRFENFRCFCREKKRGLLLVDGNIVIQKEKEEQKQIFEELLWISILEQCETAIRWKGSEQEGLEELLMEAVHIWKQKQKTLVVLTEQPVHAMERGSFDVPCAVFEIKEPEQCGFSKLWDRYIWF